MKARAIIQYLDEASCHQEEKKCCDRCYSTFENPHTIGCINTECLCHQRESEKSEEVKTTHLKIGMLRQWLNEDRITDTSKMVSSDEITYWLTLGNQKRKCRYCGTDYQDPTYCSVSGRTTDKHVWL